VGEKKRRARGINAAVMGGDTDASQCVEWEGETTGHALEEDQMTMERNRLLAELMRVTANVKISVPCDCDCQS
jgi:hypothetical protein